MPQDDNYYKFPYKDEPRQLEEEKPYAGREFKQFDKYKPVKPMRKKRPMQFPEPKSGGGNLGRL
jgi:hypothetical protein